MQKQINKLTETTKKYKLKTKTSSKSEEKITFDRPMNMQRLLIVFFVTILEYEQTVKDYRHLRKAINMKNIDFF